MATLDTVCSIYPYFLVPENNFGDFLGLCERFVEKTRQEPKCLYYGFSFCDFEVHCREAYTDAEGVLYHLENVGNILQEALEIADLTRLEIHGCQSEITKLKEPLKDLEIQYFTLKYGFRN